jgi:hypothetical protein
MYYLEKIIVVVAKLVYGIFFVLYKIIEGVVDFIMRLFRRK